jgi:hypothetical protein
VVTEKLSKKIFLLIFAFGARLRGLTWGTFEAIQKVLFYFNLIVDA